MTNVKILISPKVIKNAITLLKTHSKVGVEDEISLSLELYQFAYEILHNYNNMRDVDITSYLLAAAKLFDEDFHMGIVWSKDNWANIIDHYFPPEEDEYGEDEIHAHKDAIEKI